MRSGRAACFASAALNLSLAVFVFAATEGADGRRLVLASWLSGTGLGVTAIILALGKRVQQ